jgi:hypothetical protein
VNRPSLEEIAVSSPWWLVVFGIAPLVAMIAAALTYA